VIERPPIRSPRAAAATAHPLATESAIHIMRQGGSAADAAVGAGAVLTVVEPWASHVGGDGFAIVWDAAAGRARAIQGSGAAPMRTDPARVPHGIPLRGGIPITVPGAVGAWFHLLERMGRLPVAQVFAPAISVALDGFPAGGRWERTARLHRDVAASDPVLAGLFLRDGLPVPAGAWVRQPDLAATLTALAAGGAGAFYEGALGERIVAAIRDRGGWLSAGDLAAHRTREEEPVSFDMDGRAPAAGRGERAGRPASGGVTVFEQPPPSQGGMVLEILRWLDAADHGSRAAAPGESPIRTMAREMHMQILAYREAFARREGKFADPGATGRDAASPDGATRDTTSLCVVDPDGNAVSWIQSIFHPFGAGFVVPGTGIILNNRMTGFSLDPASANCLAPGKRPVHTLNAWMVTRGGAPWLLGGTPGAEHQVQTNVQVLRARIVHSHPLAEALRAPRWGIDARGRVAVESRLPREARRRLESLGHPVVRVGPWDGSGFVQAIERLDEGGWLAATDPRGEGLAAGF
jgi:gamma-glutamyltranspeptidase / glutathione hydrolase